MQPVVSATDLLEVYVNATCSGFHYALKGGHLSFIRTDSFIYRVLYGSQVPTTHHTVTMATWV